MPIVDNPELYKQAKAIADEKYTKPSAYKSGFIVKKYKELGGTYTDDKQPKKLANWFKEQWADIAGLAIPLAVGRVGVEKGALPPLDYPVYRPTKRVNKDTPLTPEEIDPANLLKQILLKQQLKGEYNLPAFKAGGGDIPLSVGWVGVGKGALPPPAPYKIKPYSYAQAKKLGVKIKPSDKPDKKIDVMDWNNNYILSIGAKSYKDYPTYLEEKGKDYAEERRRLYKIRHEKNRHKLGTASYYASEILW